jgi:hypothetical protein
MIGPYTPLLIYTVCVDRAESSPSPVLENIVQALQRDDFDLQHEAALALEQACLSADCKRMLLTVPQYAAQLVTLGRVFEHLLRAPGSGEAPISVMRVIGALTAAAAEIGHSSQAELVNLWVEVGITEALDDVQVRPFLCRSGVGFSCLCVCGMWRAVYGGRCNAGARRVQRWRSRRRAGRSTVRSP